MTARLGEWWLAATGALALTLLALSLAGVPWSGAIVGGVGILAGVAAVFFTRRTGGERITIDAWTVVDLFTAVLVAGYVWFTISGPPTDPDFVLIWGVKGKEFFFARGVDWTYLERPLNSFTAHTDYPLMLPLVYAATAMLSGEWNDRWLGLINAAYGLAALLVVRAVLAEELSRKWRCLATAALMPLLFSPYVGIAEAPLVAFSTAGLLFMRRGETLRGAVYLGLAAFTKNEGLTLVIAAGAALVIAGRAAELRRFWPALAVPLPWLIVSRIHGLSTELAGAGAWARAGARMTDPWPLLELLERYHAGSLLFWCGILGACVLGWRRTIGAERFLAVVIALQLIAFISAYVVSPYDLEWHVRWSWERIVRQLMPLIALLALYVNRDLLAAPPDRAEPLH